MNAVLERRDTVMPTTRDAELAATACRAMARTRRNELRVRIDDTELLLPSAVKDLLFHLLRRWLREMRLHSFPFTRN
jgi:hypothetical protein